MLFLQAKVLLLDVIRLYKQEHQFHNLIAKLRLDPNMGSSLTRFPLPLPDVKRSLSEFLSGFDQAFSQRIILTAERWLDAFYAIIIFSMAKSLLIDTLSLRDDYEKPTPWRPSDAVQIGSVYKVLVAVFTRSAKINNWCPKLSAKERDPLIIDWTSNEWEDIHPISNRMRNALSATKNLTNQASWHHGAIKSSKDFLMSLGAGNFLDLGFNGFLPQRYGTRTYRKVYPETACTRNPVEGLSAVRDFGLVRTPSAMDIDSTNVTTSSTMATALPLTTPRSIGFNTDPWPIAVGIGRSATFPQAPHERDTSRAMTSYPEADIGEPRQASSPVPRRYAPYNKHRNTVNTATSDYDEASGYYSAPSRDNPNEFTFHVAPSMYAAQQGTQAVVVAMSEETPWHMEQPSQRLDRDQHPLHGNVFNRANSSRRDHQEQNKNPGDSGNALENNVQGPAKRICNPDSPGQRAGSVVMDIDSDQARKTAESHGMTPSTYTFSIRDASTKPGPRRKALSKEQREQVAIVRRMGACSACRAKKVRVSETVCLCGIAVRTGANTIGSVTQVTCEKYQR